MSQPKRNGSKARRTPIRGKEAKKIIEAAAAFHIQVAEAGFELAEIMQVGEDRLLLLDRNPVLLMLRSGEMVPHARAVGTHAGCPTVRVDERAVPHILDGADVMVPGIVAHDEFKAGEAVAVLTQSGRTIGTGVALMGSEELASSGKGRAVHVVHTVGDEIWKVTESL